TLTNPGDRTDYTFAGTNGQVVFFDGQLGSNFVADLIAPSGTVTTLTFNVQNDSTPSLLLETGTYHLVVRGNSGATGAYRFNLLDAAAQPLLTTFPATLNDTLTPGGASAVFRVQGS